MPYTLNSELPEDIKNTLPRSAQDIYREAFNRAMNDYVAPGKRSGSVEETAHQVGWEAVRRVYEKHGVRWVAKKSIPL